MKINSLILLFLCGIIMAQPRSPMGRGPTEGNMRHAPGHPGNMREPQMQRKGRGQNRKQMSMMIMWRLTEELSLTEDQAAILFPKLKKHRDEMEQIDGELRILADDIRKIIEHDETIPDKYFDESLQKISDLEHKKVEGRILFLKSVKGTLSNVQIIKLAHFERQLKNEIRQKMLEGRPKGKRGGNDL